MISASLANNTPDSLIWIGLNYYGKWVVLDVQCGYEHYAMRMYVYVDDWQRKRREAKLTKESRQSS